MPVTPDRHPGLIDEDEGLLLEPQAVTPTAEGEVRFVTGVGFQFRELGVTKGLTGAGLTEAQHEALDTLTHAISETCYWELTRDGSGRVSTETWWTDATKVLKVREAVYARNTQQRVMSETWTQYDGVGAVKVTLTVSYTRNAQGRVVSAALVEV